MAGNEDWKCMARAQNTGPNDPADCNWPDCGCDPHATKVIAALVEQGWRAPPPPLPWDAYANRSFEPVETRAKAIYAGFVYDGPPGTSKPAWVERGNGTKQDQARMQARAELRAQNHSPDCIKQDR